jgi:hypothetical protein
MTLTFLNLRLSEKWRKAIYLLLIVCLCLCLIPAGAVLADATGGWVSQKLIGMSGVNNSQLTVGMSGVNNSWPLIIMASVEGVVNPYITTSSGEYSLNMAALLLLFAMLIIFLLKILASTGEFSIFTLIVAAVLIYVFYALFPSLYQLVQSLTGL